MPESVSILLAVPIAQSEAPATRETLRSIQSQTYPASLVNVHQVRYMAGTPGARTSALNAARELARESADAGYLIHTEPGTTWEPRKLERQVLALQAHAGAEATVHPVRVRVAGTALASPRSWSFDLAPVVRYGPRIAGFLRPPWGPGAALITIEAAARIGVFRNEALLFWEYAVRTALRLDRVEFLEEELAVYSDDREPPGYMAPSEAARRPLVTPPAEPVRLAFLKSHLDRLSTEDLFAGRPLVSKNHAELIHAALHFYAGDLLGAIGRLPGQNHPEGAGACWRAVLLRAGGDFEAAGAGFGSPRDTELSARLCSGVIALLQRVIQLPDYGRARETASRLLRHLEAVGWDAPHITRLIAESIKGPGNPGDAAMDVRLMEEVVQVECEALFDWTFAQAVGERNV